MLRLRLQPLQRVRSLPYRHLRGEGFSLKDIYIIYSRTYLSIRSRYHFFIGQRMDGCYRATRDKIANRSTSQSESSKADKAAD